MSATNRGRERNIADFYATPIEVIENFLKHYNLNEGSILEPSAGNGNFSRVIKQKYPNYNLDQIEVIDEEKSNLLQYGNVEINDFLQTTKVKDYATIITNPPYSLAQEFVEHSFNLYPNADVIMLLRLAFLESKKRYDFWQKHPVNELYILSQRPSFTGKGTDATAYAWFVWNKSGKQIIKVI